MKYHKQLGLDSVQQYSQAEISGRFKKYVSKSQIYVDPTELTQQEKDYPKTKKVFICNEMLCDIFDIKKEEDKRMTLSDLHKRVTQQFRPQVEKARILFEEQKKIKQE